VKNAAMMKTMETTEEVSSHPGEKGHCIQKWRRNTSRAGKKPGAGWKNDLQIRGAGRKSRKTTHAGCGQETIWEIPIEVYWMELPDLGVPFGCDGIFQLRQTRLAFGRRNQKIHLTSCSPSSLVCTRKTSSFSTHQR
jgi:hypothetical protein